MQLDEHAECASGGDTLVLHKIQHLLFLPLVRILCALHYALRVEKIFYMALTRDLWNFSFFGRGDASPPHSELSFCFGVIGKTPGLIYRKNFV
jgi:hypothetical protein